jgi:hypothetical protein
METTYYTCRNQHCPKYKNIFLEGDRLHAHCKRERLRFEGESRIPMWAWVAAPIALIAIAAGALALRENARRSSRPTTRGSEPVAKESERHTVPPPIAFQR